MRNWDQLVDNYIRVCEVRGLSTSSIIGRRRELDRWGTWLKRRKPKPQVHEIGPELIQDYIQSRTAFHSKASVCGVMSSMRLMGEFLVQEGVWLQNPLRWMRNPKLDPRQRLPRRIGQDHLKKLLEQAAAHPNEYQRVLWVTILAVLYGTGIRRGELYNLNISDWNSTDQTLRIKSDKVNLERLFPVPGSLFPYLEAYLPQRQNLLLRLGVTEQEALFVGSRGQRLSGFSVSRAIQRLAEKADIPIVTLHQFRHTCASDLLEEGLGLAEVQKVLGHATVATTVRYLHIADPERKKALSLHPINQILGITQSAAS
jgi:site-specific recombinase XerD